MAQDLGDRAAAQPETDKREQRAAAARARLVGSLSELADVGVRAVRLQYADLHGICRGKLIPISAFPHVAEEGVGFVEAIMTVDLRHNVIAGFEHGFPDFLARPDLNTLVPLPWEEDVVACLVDLEDPVSRQPHPLDTRGTLKRVLAEFAEVGLSPVVGPELEFYLCEPDPDRPGRYRPYAGQDSAVYTVGDIADPNGTLARLLDAAVELELGATAAAHEYGRSQFEINLRHSEALDSADRAFRFRAMIKEMAAHEGLLATFMGKPFNGDEGSGFHLHISLVDSEGANAGEDADGTYGLTAVMRHFIAGMMAHGRALMVFFNPTVNAYRRISAEVPDPGVLGPRPPHGAGAGAQGAQVLDPTRAPPRRRHGQSVPRLRRRARRRPRRHPPRARATRAGGRDDLRPGRGAARRALADHVPRGARGAQGRSGDGRRARAAAHRHVRDDQDGRARALPSVGHRLGVRGVREAALAAADVDGSATGRGAVTSVGITRS
jgi:Glutamine synthetase, catalytic domain